MRDRMHFAGGGGKCVLTITPQTHQTTIITLSDKIKTQEKGNKQQFHHCSYEVHNPWEDTMNTPINTSPFFLLSLSNILEMELERLILYTALQAKRKLNENVNEDIGVFSSPTCHSALRPLPQPFGIWLICYFIPWIHSKRGRKTERDKVVGEGRWQNG